MIFTMIGGGAHRLLATVRGALKEGVFADGGEMRFYDLNENRAAQMAAMVMKSPEYQKCPIKICWKLTLDEALKGADVVSVTLLAGPLSLRMYQEELSYAFGFIGSDNVSYSGAFLALRGAPILMNIAKHMEAICPNAILLDFANPVGVLSAMVRQFTTIRCYGVCEGYMNHGYDLTRILFAEDRYDSGYDVDVVGVNHLSFITRGTYQGKDLFGLLDKRLQEVPTWEDQLKPVYAVEGLQLMVDLYRTRHALLFSDERDGIAHFYPERTVREYSRFRINGDETGLSIIGTKTLKKESEAATLRQQKLNEEFAAFSAMPAQDIPWDNAEHKLFRVLDKGDVQAKILCGLAGIKETRVVVSSVNEGAINNMEKGLSLEFSHIVDKNGLHPIENVSVPRGVFGTVSALSIHQTLLAKACGSGSAKDLYEALLAYPIASDSQAARKLWKLLLHSSKDYIAPSFLELEKYL